MACTCGNEGTYETCCAPYHRGEAKPATAEALMRSRYSAYARGEVEYVLATHDDETREIADPDEIARWSRESEWLGLEIHDTVAGGPDDDAGEVEFTARWREGGRERAHRECSHFRRGDDGWRYVSGHMVQLPVQAGPKVGRNDPCPCGSGKKHKKCCAA